MKLLGNLNYTLQMISDELNISTTQLSKYLDSYVTIPPRPLPECLGIDEIHNIYLSRKNASYICILVDNMNRHIYDVLDSRNKTQLSKYFSQIPKAERLNVKYLTIDMWEAYEDVAKTYLPNALVAVDPFHVISHLTKGFNRLRVDLMNQCEYNSNAYYLLKNWHWLLEKDDVNLDNPRVYNHRFKQKLNLRDLRNMIFNAFPVLEQAYVLKEMYRKFNQSCTYDEAVKQLPKIVQQFKNAGIPQYDEFTEILFRWKDKILNSFLRPYGERKLSNAFTENLNGKIETYLNVSNGVSNFQRFRKRVIFALSPDVYYALTSSLHSEKREGKKRGPYNKIQD